MQNFSIAVRRPSSTRRAFTLIELLIVLAIIGLLAALLFPAFKTAQEGSYQTNCAASLAQIGNAVQLYRQDNKYYPSSLAVLLPDDFNLANHGSSPAVTNIPMPSGAPCDSATLTCPNPEGLGFFKGSRDALVCTDDDTPSNLPRSSYGDISVDINVGVTDDMGRYVWNYWGYRAVNDTSCTTTSSKGCAGTAYLTSAEATTAATADATLRLNQSAAYNTRRNPIKYSLSNRFAPQSTIVTHCVYHRIPTAAGRIAFPSEIYDPAFAADGKGAKDIVLRVDGSAKAMDVSEFVATLKWQKQNF